jgi:hypothetical protein
MTKATRDIKMIANQITHNDSQFIYTDTSLNSMKQRLDENKEIRQYNIYKITPA